MHFIIVSIFAILFAIWYHKRTKKPPGFPPGPPRWPIVGSLPFIAGKNGNLLLGLRDNVKKYGPVVGYYIGNTPTVLVSDFNVLKEICKLDSLSYRPSISPIHFYTEGWETMKGAGPENIGRSPGINFTNILSISFHQKIKHKPNIQKCCI